MLIFYILSFGQSPTEENLSEAVKKWVYYSNGNPIDGYTKESIRINDGADINSSYLIIVQNSAATIKLKNSIGEAENDRDNLLIDLKAISSNSFSDLNELFMYFDNDKSYYKVNFRVYNENGLIWWNAVEKNDTKFLDRFDFVNKLKSQSNVTFRFIFSDGQFENITFSLNGSKIALDQTVDLYNFTNDGVNGFRMDMVYGTLRIGEIYKNENLNNDLEELNTSLDDFNSKLLPYLENNLGKFHSAFIGKINYENKILYFYDLNDKIILEIDIAKELI
jgi:hypothetical protein